MYYLNLGCGNRYHPKWINIDINAKHPNVFSLDVCKGIPLEDNCCEAVYHSHLLEHLKRIDARFLMKECFRVLRRGGVIRVAVPDLEKICKIYLKKYELALAGDKMGAADYDWILLEMFDQMVREQSGGDMLDYLCRQDLPNRSFLYSRIGEELNDIVEHNKVQYARSLSSFKLSNGSIKNHLKMSKCVRLLAHQIQAKLLRVILGEERIRAYKIGLFRLQGEIHHWMYDRFSLSRLLVDTGFRNPIVVSACCSQSPSWSEFNLDTLPNGTVIKPDSLFMEAIKPE
jgi:predicted SAM-dependent methyltransferase